jgi:hypothetical protein
MLLAAALALFTLGASLIVYGSTLPEDFVVHGIWDYSNQDETNILMFMGVFPICIGAAVLLFWFFTRSKPAVSLAEQKVLPKVC